MEEKALCNICEKQIDSDASTLKAAGLERIIQVSEDIQEKHEEKHYQFQFMQDVDVITQNLQQ